MEEDNRDSTEEQPPDNDLSAEAMIDRVIDTSVIRLDLTDDGSMTYIDVARLNYVAQNALTYAVQSSPGKQFGIGFGVGWLSGYLFKKVSRAAAILFGCGFLLLQGASSLGIITVNWEQMRFVAMSNMRRVQRRVSHSSSEGQSILDKMIDLSHQHMYLCSGFSTGAIIAITF